MNVAERIRKSKKPLFSFEILPPLKGHNIDSIYKTIDPLVEFEPSHINITYHQEEQIYKKHESGLLARKTVRKRPGTVAISAAIKYKYPGIDVVPHLICGGFSKDSTEYALIDLNFLGINDLMIVRGDPPKQDKYFKAEEDGHKYAVDLVKQILDMNNGKYLDKELQNSTTMNFSVGVAAYPEKHLEAPNIESDLVFLKEKIDAGAEYVVTQMFFDNKKYYDFVEMCRNNNINVPIIPGLKPITTINDINTLPKTFNIDLPEDLTKQIRKCKNNQEAFNVGTEWGIMQAKELIKNDVPALHFFTIGISDNIKEIAKAVL